MKREIVIQASPEESRVLVLEGGRAVEIHVERDDDRDLVGTVFVGRVERVLPGMQSAFIDVGLDRHAFLFIGDVLSDLGDEPSRPAPSDLDGPPAPARRKATAEQRIEEVLSEGQVVVVQVTRDPFGKKGARVTTDVTLAGQYLVYLPYSEHLGVSKRIEDPARRERLRLLLAQLRGSSGGGLIARTAAAEQSDEALRADRDHLLARWKKLQARLKDAQPPARLLEEPSLPLRVVRDLVSPDVARIVVDDETLHGEVLAFVEQHAPALAPRVQRFEGTGSVLEALGVEAEIERALRHRVWLKSGGTLIINQMEALVAIDVNTGKYTGTRALEDTALKTNLEAAREVARQLRLRDLGGIIVIDFIDLVESSHRESVLQELLKALAADRAKTTVLGMSDFGIVQITRQKQRRSLEATLCEPCPYCAGLGRVKSIATTTAQVLRRVREFAREAPAQPARLHVHPDVARAVRRRLASLEATGRPLGLTLEVVEEPNRHRETFDLGA